MNGGTSPRQRLWLDPRTKILLLLLCILSAMMAPSLYYELGLVVLIGLFGACCGKWKYAWKGAAFYGLIVLLTFWIMDTMTGTWRTMFHRIPWPVPQGVPLRDAVRHRHLHH